MTCSASTRFYKSVIITDIKLVTQSHSAHLVGRRLASTSPVYAGCVSIQPEASTAQSITLLHATLLSTVEAAAETILLLQIILLYQQSCCSSDVPTHRTDDWPPV